MHLGNPQLLHLCDATNLKAPSSIFKPEHYNIWQRPQIHHIVTRGKRMSQDASDMGKNQEVNPQKHTKTLHPE